MAYIVVVCTLEADTVCVLWGVGDRELLCQQYGYMTIWKGAVHLVLPGRALWVELYLLVSLQNITA